MIVKQWKVLDAATGKQLYADYSVSPVAYSAGKSRRCRTPVTRTEVNERTAAQIERRYGKAVKIVENGTTEVFFV